MKKLKKSALVLCLFAFAQLFGQTAPEVHFKTMESETLTEELSYEYLMAHNVFLREKPSLKSKRLAVLSIGTKLVLREESQNSEEMNGIKSNWYRVNAGEQTGWVWGGMIAQKAFGSNADSKIKFVYGYESSITNNEGIVETKYQLRAFKNGVELDKIVLAGLASIPAEVKNIGDKGLSNVNDIITLALTDYDSGKRIGKSYIFWNRGKFFNVANLIDYSNASYSKTESFVFPSDMEGTRNRITLKTIITDNKIALKSDLVQTNKKFISSSFTWNGYLLSEKEGTAPISKDAIASSANF